MLHFGKISLLLFDHLHSIFLEIKSNHVQNLIAVEYENFLTFLVNISSCIIVLRLSWESKFYNFLNLELVLAT